MVLGVLGWYDLYTLTFILSDDTKKNWVLQEKLMKINHIVDVINLITIDILKHVYEECDYYLYNASKKGHYENLFILLQKQCTYPTDRTWPIL